MLSGASHAARPGDNAPACNIPHMDGSTTLDLSERHDKVLYVDFWASWCPTCKKSFPSLNRLHNELKERGFEVVAINLDENKDDALEFLKSHPVNFPVAYDGEGECPSAFNVMAMPTSFIIDKKGVVREVHLGFDKDKFAEIKSTVMALLDE